MHFILFISYQSMIKTEFMQIFVRCGRGYKKKTMKIRILPTSYYQSTFYNNSRQMKNTILFGNQYLTRFTAEIIAKILQNILRIFFVAKNRNFFHAL